MQSAYSRVVVRGDGRAQGLLAIGVAIALLAILALAQPAKAAFGIDSFSNTAQRADLSEETQAGAHPYSATVSFAMNQGTHALFGGPVPDENVRTITVDLPAGFVGDPAAIPTCTTTQLSAVPIGCPTNSQVGIVAVDFAYGFGPVFPQGYPVFNMKPGKGQVARFGFNPQVAAPIVIDIGVRSDSDYGVRATLPSISSGAPFVGSRLTLWGVPADPSHDAQRGAGWVCFDDPVVNPGSCAGGGAAAGLPLTPFLTNPTYCGDPLETTMSAVSWQTGANDSKTYTTASGITGCDKLHFDPTISVTPDSTQADAPTGLAVDLAVPQNGNPVGYATPTLRNAVVTLPDGMTLNPPEADGLTGCTDAQAGLQSTDPVACPESSKIGDVEITTPLLAEHLTGSIFLGQPVPGKKFRIFLVAESAVRGISVRLEGVLALDPVTGRVTTTFENTPQLPFSLMHLHFKGGPRAPLTTPTTCGTKTTTAELTPWADPNASPVTTTSSFDITADGHGAACPAQGFSPGFSAGLTQASGGQDGTFTMVLTRDDGEQQLRSIAMSMPEGLLAHLADVPVLCADAQAAAGTCDEGSRIGSVVTGVGSGASPFYLPGRVYITGPYGGGPFGLSIVVPAVAGPFDLGTVVVRAAIYLDQHTTALRIVSDPLPTIVEGVPLRLRKVNVTIDRPDFMVAPTNCTPSSIDGQIASTTGTVSDVSSRFQVTNCAGLPFAPKMQIRVGAAGHVGRGASTPLTAVVRMSPGQANLRGVSVTLPTTINARLPVINKACTLAEFQAGDCDTAKAGTAVATTPLLRDPLVGGVYFVRNGRPLPDMMVALRSTGREAGVAVDLDAKVTIRDNKYLSTNFDTIPDVPVTKFVLHLVSGKQGPVGAAVNLCTWQARRARMDVAFTAQNGKRIDRTQRLGIRGCVSAAAGARR